jgi:hypothetical protein
MAFGQVMFALLVTTGIVATRPVDAAEPPPAVCSLRAAAAGTCVAASVARWQDPAAPPPASGSAAPPPTRKRDSLKNGAIIGGAIGFAVGLIGSGIADCPGDDPSGSCPAARVAGVVLSTAIWSGIGVGVDALVADRTMAFSPPGAPGRTRTRALPPRPSLAMRLRW